ncbi:ISNCY family transposase [Acidithiobacillus sp. AMEEHan]|uniref:ISNCY family transposase n=1 Tax=Acidithiobacillus sp. AMEEHan TaxID=2994951 RepID=UPI0027E58E73|nr:ISNCY family transposase [Acidithiobacillus sp. AMEEHan]
MEKRIEMNERELERLKVLERVLAGDLDQKQAAMRLGLTDRQVRRLMRRYECEGAAGLISRRRGKPSNRRLAPAVQETILARVQERYADFGPTLAVEYLRGEGLRVSKETLRGWMVEAGLWKARQKRSLRLHPPRPRRVRRGELVQIDGSPHDWFEGRGPRCCLIAFIDDATSQVMFARFVPVESTQAYLDVLKAYVTTYGCPVALYSDRHGIFTKHNPEDGKPTQFQRATASLGIETIQALTPQAKGRVERLFQTLQDRLVKAMRLADIADIEAANVFLTGYLPEHNARFAVAPLDPADAHQSYEGEASELARICAIQHPRTLSKDLVLSFRRQRYIVQTNGAPRYALRGKRITVVEYGDGRVELLAGQEILPYKVFDPAQDVFTAVDDKTLNARVDAILTTRQLKEKWRPGPDHPWRRAFATPAPGDKTSPLNRTSLFCPEPDISTLP